MGQQTMSSASVSDGCSGSDSDGYSGRDSDGYSGSDSDGYSGRDSDGYSGSDSDDYKDGNSDADNVTVPDYVRQYEEHKLPEGPLSERDAKKMAGELKRASAYSLMYCKKARDKSKRKTLTIQCTKCDAKVVYDGNESDNGKVIFSLRAASKKLTHQCTNAMMEA